MTKSVAFVAYKDFCSHYEQLAQDMDIYRHSVPNWPILGQGIEALSKSVASMESRALEPNKSMSLNDLLIKVGTKLQLGCTELSDLTF